MNDIVRAFSSFPMLESEFSHLLRNNTAVLILFMNVRKLGGAFETCHSFATHLISKGKKVQTGFRVARRFQSGLSSEN